MKRLVLAIYDALMHCDIILHEIVISVQHDITIELIPFGMKYKDGVNEEDGG